MTVRGCFLRPLQQQAGLGRQAREAILVTAARLPDRQRSRCT